LSGAARSRAAGRLLLLLALPLAGCAARGPVPPTEVASDEAVRVDTRAGTRYEGRLRALASDSIRVVLDSGDVALARADVTAMSVQRSQWQRGAWMGGLLVGVPSAAAFALLCAISRADNGTIGDEGSGLDCAVVFGLAGGAAGGLLGGLIGSRFDRWVAVELSE